MFDVHIFQICDNGSSMTAITQTQSQSYFG
jgi:hypothetical protein